VFSVRYGQTSRVWLSFKINAGRWKNSKLQTPPSRQRGRYNITNSNCLTQNLEEIANLVAGPRWAPDAKKDWPTHMSVVM
jgi:hypothetical protein